MRRVDKELVTRFGEPSCSGCVVKSSWILCSFNFQPAIL